ncbi:putative bifunctional diguanylate cyclase/phosphodiesterase [Janthinobacterium agaricidamnosum]|uniref:Sensory box protein n=1 Tax=Janthinobacterium agaricidamnosum NBRC 102515 = DSM 9628 TaxID=1349767 RepID=W0V3T5_9BURK|nr:EAL domain-containing protein [Janthinobacterium agaricidamnosum]CDG82536.1 sensory box protein [Janthinobacterium agaricidamnosum NBRC 102515 = DSM 9628]
MDQDLHGTYPQHAMLATMSGAGLSDPYCLDDAAFSPERLRHEREQAYFNDIYLLAPVAYFVLGFDTTILQVNLLGAELLGVTRAHPGHIHFRQFVSAPFLHDFDDFVQHALNSSQPERMQLKLLRTPQDQGLPVSLLASVDGSGQALRVVVEQAEGKQAALERSEERFRRIVHSAEEGIWELDASALTSFVNPKMARMLGYSIEEMLGKPLLAFMDDEGRTLLERHVARRQEGVAERHEFKFLRKDGAALWATLATNPIFDGGGACLGALALVSDITERKESAERIWRQANFDELTSLPNRHMFLDRLRNEARKAKRDGRFLALLFIDLDGFKQVNDQLGHDKGDLLLAEAAQRIAEGIRASDTVARLGGDEFTVILSGFEQLAGVERVVQEVIGSLARPFVVEGDHAQISASIGIALYPADASDTDSLLRHADQAMYAAKNAGRNRYSYFTPAVQAAAQLRLRTAGDLRQALQQEQFEIHYQPIVNLQTGAIHRAEALLRWRHPRRGLLSPADFIPYAESGGLMIEIGDWVFRQAVRQVRQWQLDLDPVFQVSVNKSPLEFRGDTAFYQAWTDYLEQQGLPPCSIAIEITEGVLLDEACGVLERLRQFRAMGLEVALDDFGTGYASLSCLRKFDIDYLKIDPSFVQELAADGNGGELVLCEAIIALAHKLGVKVVAEGVETEHQRSLLAGAGCDYAQGYLFAQPMPAQQLAALVRSAGKPDDAKNLSQ